jgi:hypothetical protein
MNQLQSEIARIADTAVVRIVGAFTLATGHRPSLALIDKIREAVYDSAGLFALAGVSAASRERMRRQETLPSELQLAEADGDEDQRPTQPNLPRIGHVKKGPPPPPPPRKQRA